MVIVQQFRKLSWGEWMRREAVSMFGHVAMTAFCLKMWDIMGILAWFEFGRLSWKHALFIAIVGALASRTGTSRYVELQQGAR